MCSWSIVLPVNAWMVFGTFWTLCSRREAVTMMEYLRPEGCIYRVWCGSRAEADGVVQSCRRIYGA
jgi:hypothetical protein